MKLAIIVQLNDVVKRGILRDWLRNNPSDVKRIQDELSKKGKEVKIWWLKKIV
ncbi:MAG: hypothetical protein PVG65_01655 [Candidatus Thorarchaeota archaeon]|jgi:hypothetical protein